MVQVQRLQNASANTMTILMALEEKSKAWKDLNMHLNYMVLSPIMSYKKCVYCNDILSPAFYMHNCTWKHGTRISERTKREKGHVLRAREYIARIVNIASNFLNGKCCKQKNTEEVSDLQFSI